MKSKKSESETYLDTFDMRVNKGISPTIEIAGHTFYVDIRMNKLRPKDNFLSNGIVFSEIEDYYNEEKKLYVIPYDPQKKEHRKIDYETITEVPKELIVVKIPSLYKLYPIGWNRQHGYELKEGLKNLIFKMNFKAKTGKWDDIYIPQKIRENLESLKNSNSKGLKL